MTVDHSLVTFESLHVDSSVWNNYYAVAAAGRPITIYLKSCVYADTPLSIALRQLQHYGAVTHNYVKAARVVSFFVRSRNLVSIFGLESRHLSFIHYRPDLSYIKIGSGSKDVTALKKRDIVRFVEHPKYDSEVYDYDVAVVKVTTPFVVSAVEKPVALVEAGEYAAAGEPVVVSGWGINRVSAYFNGKFEKKENKRTLSLLHGFKCHSYLIRMIIDYRYHTTCELYIFKQG